MNRHRLHRWALYLSFLFLVSLFILPAISPSASAREVIRFGPKKYTRTTGKPNTYTDTFTASGSIGGGKLIVENGDANGDHRISSAVISLNGKEVFGPSAFNQQVGHLEAPISLLDTNTLTVELRSKPGSYLTIRVTQEIPLEVTITAPSDGATVTRNEVMVEGMLTSPPGDEIGVVVNGMVALVHGNQFVASHCPLQQGANTITAQATDTAGNTVTASITVNAVIPEDYIKITADTEMGISPLETTVRIDGSFSFAQDPALTYSGPGEIQVIENPTPTEYRVKMTTPGVYSFMAEGIDQQNNTYTDTVTVLVLNKAELDALLRTKWEGMRGALAQNDVDTAASYFDDVTRDAYKGIFTALSSKLPQMAQEMSDIQFILMMGASAEYDIRTIRDGTEYSFYLLFVRNKEGLWKISRF